MLLLLSSVLFSKEQVEYPQQHICAVKGSSVVIHCSFFCPETAKVQSVKWGHERSSIYTGPFIFDSESNTSSSRFQYIGDNIHNCSFKIHQVEHDDEGKYAFRFTYRNKNKMDAFTGNVGPVLTVAALKVRLTKLNGNNTMKEGDSVNLTCINRCDGDGLSSAFLWFKNEEPVNDGPVLYLNNMSHTDSGNYTCSLKTHNGTTSGVRNIDVECDNITLICTSKANPPVETYTWFKMNGHNIINIGKEAELHFRKILHHDGGQYFCMASNKHGSQKSSLVTLKIKGKFIKMLLVV
uniref:Ig-like domain-containing protein n=1 Tax=Mastacembelus armatus TaxID=205130 RepID=A0A3Q3N904_9TELE